MTGLLDHLFPLLDALDAGLATFLPAWARLAVFGAISGVVTMALYVLFSNQPAIQAQKVRLRAIQAELKAAQDDLAATMRLSRQNLAAAFGLLGRVLLPAVLSSLPVVVVIGWLAVHWSHAEPPSGAPVPVQLAPGDAAVTFEPDGSLVEGPDGRHLVWPADGTRLRLMGPDQPLWEGSPEALATTAEVTKPRWWNLFLGNPAGYLPETGPLDAVSVSLPSREVLGFGPGWLRGWMAVYFLSVVVVSLTIKFVFKIA